MERKLIEGPSSLKLTEGGYQSEKFVSVADTVKVLVIGEADAKISMTLYAYDKDGKQFEVKTVGTEEREFSLSYELDPASLAVYSAADSFNIEIYSEGNITVRELSIMEIITEPSDMWRDSLDALTTLEDGTPAVYITTAEGEKKAVARVPKKVLFIGNSLVFGMSHGYYGMCATAPDKDYFHYVSSYIKKYNPECKFTKLYGSYLEHSENMEMFDDWYYHDAMKQFTVDDNFISADDMLEPDLDLILMQMGDNVNTEEKMQTYKVALYVFMERVKKKCKNARIIFVHSWYGIFKTGHIIKDVCDKWQVERVDISCLHNISTEAREQKTYVTRDGSLANVSERWISHPGDLGMKKIADRIIEKLKLEK